MTPVSTILKENCLCVPNFSFNLLEVVSLKRFTYCLFILIYIEIKVLSDIKVFYV